MLVEVRDHNGSRVTFNKESVISVQEAGPSSSWHGIHSLIRLVDGRLIECQDTYSQVQAKLNQSFLTE